MSDTTYVIIPAYNEMQTIGNVIKKTQKYCKNIIVVDDGSQDSTADEASIPGVIILRHMVNLGKGAALKTGCEYAIRKGAKKLILMDADGQHNPEDIPRFLEHLGRNDIVFGSRTLNKEMPAIFKFGNSVINSVNRILFKVRLHDTQSGFRAMTARAYRKIEWDAQDYSVESEMVANTGKKALKYSEITIKTIYSDRYKGTTVLDGIKIVLNMLWWRITKWH